MEDLDKLESVIEEDAETLLGVIDLDEMLKDPEGYKEFQVFYREIRNKLKRNDDNSVVLPVMLALDTNDKIVSIAQTIEDVKNIAKLL